jgi:hypothetical protein
VTLSPFQYNYNGLTFGSGTDVQIVKEEGIRSLPATRAQDVNRPRQDGAFAGLNFLSERVVVLTLSVTVTKNASFDDTVASIVNAFQPISDPTQQKVLKFRYPGWSEDRQLTGRVTRVGFPVDLNYSFHRIDALPVEIVCADPNIYSSTQHSHTLALTGTVGGLTFPVTFPAVFYSTSGNSWTTTNTGNATAYPVLTITGPIINPRIENATTGEYIKLNLAVGPTDTLVIDMNTGVVVLNGTTTRVSAIARGSSWWGLQPGVANTITLTSDDSAAVAGTVDIAYRDTWSWC